MSLQESLGVLEVGVSRVRLVAQERAELPWFLGSTLRGALGWALKGVGCPRQCEEPKRCVARAQCAYAWCFETHDPGDEAAQKAPKDLPHPFVLAAPDPRDAPWAQGEALDFGLVLVGRSAQFWTDFARASEQLARHGLGTQRAPFKLEALLAEDGTPLWQRGAGLSPLPTRSVLRDLPPAPARVAMTFHTPLRLIEQGRELRRFPFRTLGRNLLGRLFALMETHAATPLDVRFDAMLQAAEQVECVRSELRWLDLERWSNRQQKHTPLSGLVGQVVWEGEGLRPWWPALWAGQSLHVGKGAVFGLGRYTLDLDP
jgi:hypothetical protein